MKTFMRVLFVAVLIALSGLMSVRAQQLSIINSESGRTEYLRWFVGGYGGVAANLHSAQFGALPGYASCCDEFGSQLTFAPNVGLIVEFPLITDLRLQLRAGYTALGGTLRRSEVIGNEPVLGGGPIPTTERRDITVDHTLDAGLSMVTLEPTVDYQLVDGLWLSAGGRAGYLIASDFSQAETLVSPDGYTFTDGRAVRNDVAADIPDVSSVQLAATAGMRYEVPLSARATLSPEARYYLPLTPISTAISSADWRVQSVYVGASVRVGIYTPNDRQILRDTVVERDTILVYKTGLVADSLYLSESSSAEQVADQGDVRMVTTTISESWVRARPKPFSPTLAVDFRTSGSGGDQPLTTIRIQELDVVESYPLLPQIFFDSASTEVVSTGQRMLTPAEAQQFFMNNLQRDQIQVYSQLLNVIGSRMQQDAQAVLTILGTTDNVGAEKDNLAIAEARANSVRAYLHDVWGIAEQRLQVKRRLVPVNHANLESDEGRAENRRVELSSSSLTTFEPVEFRERDVIVTPSVASLVPAVSNGEGIVRWSSEIEQGGRILASASGTGVPSTPLNWKSGDQETAPRTDKPVVGLLTVENVLGQSVTVADTVTIDFVSMQLMKSMQEGGKRVERYSLIVFDYNSAELNPANRKVMDQVRSRIEPTSKVTILGFADRSGNPESNRALARRRCVEAQKALGLSDDRVTIVPVGSDRLIYDNDTPIGRSYSRTVQIEVETPVRE